MIFKDLNNLISSYITLGWIEVKLRYTRSLLGPFWITLSACVLIGGMTLVNLSLFKVNISEVMPWIAIGIITWNYIATTIEESLALFEDQKLLNVRIDPIELVAINVSKNIIIFFHNLVIIIPVVIFFDLPVTRNYLFLLYALVIFLINSFSFSILFGFLCLRYRDFILIVKNLLFLLFLMTPIFWIPANLNNNRMALADYNILFQIIQTIRDPLLGNPLSIYCLLMTSIFTLLIALIAYFIYRINKTKVVFWI